MTPLTEESITVLLEQLGDLLRSCSHAEVVFSQGTRQINDGGPYLRREPDGTIAVRMNLLRKPVTDETA